MSKKILQYGTYDCCESCGNFYEKMFLLGSTAKHIYCVICIKAKLRKVNKTRVQSYRGYQSNEFLPKPEIFVKPKKTTMTLNIKKASSLMDLSKRPFQCPNGDCNKFVSVNNLHAHFRYEHPSIDNLFTNFNERNKIQVYLNDIKYDTSQCIFILNVVAANSPSHTFTCKPTSQFGLLQILENPNPMLFLLTSRVRVGVPENQDSELESSETDETSQSCDDENSENYPLFKENDYVIIWLASNLLWSNLRCTISASTNVHDVRLNYYGTIQDLRNGPSEVHQNSRCLMLSHYHCDKMTENGLKSVLLDVEIHEA